MKRKTQISYFLLILMFLLTLPHMILAAEIKSTNYTSTSAMLNQLTPQLALLRLIKGNDRFFSNQSIKRNLLEQVKITSLKGQFPSAVILSCMDSRTSSELIFDQGLGDIFSIRVAGNIIDDDQLGSMEYAVAEVGSKVIVVMGHTKCGAVEGACLKVSLGNLTQLLEKIQPAVKRIRQENHEKLNCHDDATLEKIAKANVLVAIKEIKEESPTISQLIKHKNILLVGAMYDVRTGKVNFFDEQGKNIDVKSLSAISE